MSAGPFVFPYKCILNFYNATNLLGANVANFKLALVANTLNPDDDTIEVWADVSANELANGGGYTTGGGALTGVTLAAYLTGIKFTANAFVWTASGGGIPAWRYGFVYYNGTLNGKVNPIVGYFEGDSSGSPATDVPLTTGGNTLTVTPDSTNGMLRSYQV